MAQTRDEPSIGDLFSELVRESTTLVRQEVQLAKAELTQTATNTGRDVASMAIGGAVAYAGLLAVLAAVILGLGELGVPWWLAALIVGVVVATAGYVMISRARADLQKTSFVPKQTIESLKEDREWAKEQIR